MRIARTALMLAMLVVACWQGPRITAAEDAPPAPPPEVVQALQGLASKERDERVAAAGQATSLQHEALVQPLLKLLKDEYRTVREAAAKALATRDEKGAKVKAAKALEARLNVLSGRGAPEPLRPQSKPDAVEELKVVVEALHDLAQPSSIAPLLDGMEPTTDLEIARSRTRAVGNIASLDAIEALIRHAAKGGRGSGEHRGPTMAALEYATGVKLANLDAWHIWWAENKKTFDVVAAARQRAERRSEAEAKREKKDEAREKRKEKERAKDDPAKTPADEPPKDPPPDAPKKA